MEVRDYQTKAIEDIDKNWMTHRRVLLVSPTGSGKTVIASRIARLIKDVGRRCVFLVHKRELFAQTVATLIKSGLHNDIGVVSADDTRDTWQPFIVASIPTLVRRPRLKLPADIVVIDEAHHAAARTWANTVDERWPKAHILGMTATPRRTDSRALGQHFDVIVQTPQIAQMIKGGYLCDFDVLKPPYALKTKGVKVAGSDFDHTSMKKALEKTRGKTIIEVLKSWSKHARDMKTIIFAVDIAHSKKIAEAFRAAGYTCAHIDADTDSDLRDKTLRLFRAGQIQVITNVRLLSEGLDVPDCQCVVMARPTASIIDYFQQAGRMMRPKRDGKKGLLLDLAGNFYIHGLTPKDVVKWSLDGEPNPDHEKGEAKAISYHTCENCIRPYNSMRLKCPHCGHERERSGQLVEEIEASLVKHRGKEANASFQEMVEDIYRGNITMQSIIDDIMR